MIVFKKRNVCSTMNECLTEVEPEQNICSSSSFFLVLCLSNFKSFLVLSSEVYKECISCLTTMRNDL